MLCLGLGGPVGERALAGLPDPGTRSGHGNIRRAASRTRTAGRAASCRAAASPRRLRRRPCGGWPTGSTTRRGAASATGRPGGLPGAPGGPDGPALNSTDTCRTSRRIPPTGAAAPARDRSGARAPRARDCRTSRRCRRTRPRAGSGWPCPSGTAGGNARPRSAPPPPCGATPACRWCRSAGCCRATPGAASTRRPCPAPIRRATRGRSCAGSSGAGGGCGALLRTLPGGARPPRGRDPTSVVGPRHRARHAPPARAVLDHHLARGTPRPPRPLGRLHGRLVPRAAPDLRRRPGRRPAPGLGGAGLGGAGLPDVPAAIRGQETPPRPPPRHRLRALPRRLMAKVELSRS